MQVHIILLRFHIAQVHKATMVPNMQEAHVTQARLVRKLESEKVQSKQTLDTVKSQEGVISKLEGLLKQAMAERRAAVATAEKVQQHVTSLESTIESSQAQVSVDGNTT